MLRCRFTAEHRAPSTVKTDVSLMTILLRGDAPAAAERVNDLARVPGLAQANENQIHVDRDPDGSLDQPGEEGDVGVDRRYREIRDAAVEIGQPLRDGPRTRSRSIDAEVCHDPPR